MPSREQLIKSNWVTYPVVGMLLQMIDPAETGDMTFIGWMGFLMMLGWGVAVLVKAFFWMMGPLRFSGMPSFSTTRHMWKGIMAHSRSRYDQEKLAVQQIQAQIVEANSKGIPVACSHCEVVPEQLFVNASGAYCAACIHGSVSDVAYDTANLTSALLYGQG